MKISYSLLKEFVPALPPKEKLIELLSLRAFETEALPAAESNNGDLFEIKIPANRYSDAASYWGLARIIAAITGVKAVIPQIANRKSQIAWKPKAASFSVEIETKTCRGMRAWHISDVKVGPSPKWLADAVHSAGINSINNVVDITNYVMIETGQPLHAFDYDKIAGHQMIIRPAKAGEELETLDGKKFKLNSNIAVIADSEKALDVAGIKGGKDSGITEKTTSILLTGGNWDGAIIYKTARALGLHTDASARFSHNISPALTELGVSRAAELIAKHVSGKLGESVAVGKLTVKPLTIPFDVKQFNALTGFDLTAAQCFNYLKKLGFVIKGKNVSVPAARTDVWQIQDLIEEVVNVHGYDRLQPQKPMIEMTPAVSDPMLRFKDKIKDTLVGMGLSEVYNYSFISKEQATAHLPTNANAHELANPTSDEYSHLRPRLVSGLLKNVRHNARFSNVLDIFEIGSVFYRSGGVLVEEMIVNLASYKENAAPYLQLKGTLEGLLSKLGVPFTLAEPEDKNASVFKFLAAESVLSILVDGQHFGWIGLSKEQPDVALASIHSLAKLRALLGKKIFKTIPKYPSMARDLSVLADKSLRSAEVVKAARLKQSSNLVDAALVDSFTGDKLPKDKKSLTFRFTFQSPARTLTDTEVNETFADLTAALKNAFNFEIR